MFGMLRRTGAYVPHKPENDAQQGNVFRPVGAFFV